MSIAAMYLAMGLAVEASTRTVFGLPELRTLPPPMKGDRRALLKVLAKVMRYLSSLAPEYRLGR